jgi:hypothetical protein
MAMNKPTCGIGVALASLALWACETSGGGGTGGGNVRGTQKPVAFTWQSDDRDSGDITATFGNGRVFKGKYYQITDDTRVERLDPLWDGWDGNRRGNWRYWSDNDDREFVRAYDGRVLANLRANDGEHMRCRFTLISPTRGMAGGGEGRCQLSESSREINAEFPRQS